jgi:hypothetical protein
VRLVKGGGCGRRQGEHASTTVQHGQNACTMQHALHTPRGKSTLVRGFPVKPVRPLQKQGMQVVGCSVAGVSDHKASLLVRRV